MTELLNDQCLQRIVKVDVPWDEPMKPMKFHFWPDIDSLGAEYMAMRHFQGLKLVCECGFFTTHMSFIVSKLSTSSVSFGISLKQHHW